MKRIARRVAFYALLGAAVVASLWWFTHFPPRPARAYRAIPEGADWISVHRRPADHWDEWMAFPAAESVARAVGGMDSAAWAAFRQDGRARELIRTLVPEELVVAHFEVRDLGRHAWVASSWLGDRAIRYRWLLDHAKQYGITSAGQYAGRRLWYVPPRMLPAGWTGTFAIDEGLLIVCISRSPGDLRFVLDAYDGITPRAPEARIARDLPGAHVAWCQTGDPRTSPREVTLCLTRFNGEGLTLEGAVNGQVGALSGTGERAADRVGVADLFGSAPDALFALDRSVALSGASLLPSNHWGQAVFQLAADHTDGPFYLGIAGAEFGGRFRGMKVPGFFLAARQRGDEAAFQTALSRQLDDFNRDHQWGLITAAVPGLPSAARSIEGTTDTDYSKMPPSERPCVLLTNGWVVVAASSETMAALFRPDAPAGPALWAKAFGPDGATVRGWMEPRRGARTARLAGAVYSLWLISRQGDRSAPARAQVEKLVDAFEWLAPFARVVVEARPESAPGSASFVLRIER